MRLFVCDAQCFNKFKPKNNKPQSTKETPSETQIVRLADHCFATTSGGVLSADRVSIASGEDSSIIDIDCFCAAKVYKTLPTWFWL